MSGKEGEGKLKAISGFWGVVRFFFFFLEHKILTLLPFSFSVFRGVTWKRNREDEDNSSWSVCILRGHHTTLGDGAIIIPNKNRLLKTSPF